MTLAPGTKLGPYEILNPHGVEIDLPFWVFKRLRKLHLLERDSASGMRRIQARIFGLMDLWEGPDFRPDISLESCCFAG